MIQWIVIWLAKFVSDLIAFGVLLAIVLLVSGVIYIVKYVFNYKRAGKQ